MGKRKWIMIIAVTSSLFGMNFFTQACSKMSGFKTLDSASSIISQASSAGNGSDTTNPPASGGNDPQMPPSTPANPDVPKVPPPPQPLIGSMDPYIPQIPADQCKPKLQYTDPFVGLSLNKKTVCAQGCNFNSIAAAAANAQPNDEILIEPGNYKECIVLNASPVVMRGNGGMVQIDSVDCGAAAVVRVNSQYAKVNNFKITNINGKGFEFLPTSQFAELSDFWVEGAYYAVTAAIGQGTLILNRFKVKDVGAVYGPTNHKTSTIQTENANLIISLGTFSHHRYGSWALTGSNTSGYNEFLCNVDLKMSVDDAHSLHFNSAKYLRIAHNFIYQHTLEYVFFSQNIGDNSKIEWENNYMINNHPTVNFYGLYPQGTGYSLTGNTFVGAPYPGMDFSGLFSVNTHYPSLQAAGIDPYPAIPKKFPDQC